MRDGMSSIDSFHCATHPTVRATANMTVYMDTGMPNARSTMPIFDCFGVFVVLMGRGGV
jgi:hypothetical protein